MPNIASHPYQDITRFIPVNNHTIQVNVSVWRSLLNNIQAGSLRANILLKNNQLTINRWFLKHHAFPSIEEKIIHILMWGYPSGGRGNNIQKTLGQLHQIASVVNQNTPWSQFYGALKTVPGVGISTITKFAYFFGKKFQKYDALILDLQIADILIAGHWTGLTSPRSKSENHLESHYLQYLSDVQAIAGSIGCPSDNIELFLFLAGKSFC